MSAVKVFPGRNPRIVGSCNGCDTSRGQVTTFHFGNLEVRLCDSCREVVAGDSSFWKNRYDALQAKVSEAQGYLNDVMAHSLLCRREAKGHGCHVCALLAILSDTSTEGEGT